MFYSRWFTIACVAFAFGSNAPVSAQQTVPHPHARPTKSSLAALFRALGVTQHNASGIEISDPPGVNLVLIKKLLAQGVDVNGKNSTGYTPLLVAVMADEHAVTKLLLDKGANVNLAGSGGQTALMQAAETSDVAMMQLLCDYGAKIDAQDRAGLTSLMYAALNLDSQKVALLLRRHTQVNLRDNGHHTVLSLLRTFQTNASDRRQKKAITMRLLKQAGAKE